MGEETVNGDGGEHGVTQRTPKDAQSEQGRHTTSQGVTERHQSEQRPARELNKVDWLTIRHAVMTEGRKTTPVAREFAVPKSTLCSRRSRERWSVGDCGAAAPYNQAAEIRIGSCSRVPLRSKRSSGGRAGATWDQKTEATSL
jgi:hypothetical protein